MKNFLDLVKEYATEKTITVYETDNFDIFSLNEYNREISKTKVAKFMEQDLKDVIYPVNDKGEILDGQHRIMACKELNKKIRFTIINDADEDYIHDINTVGTVWTAKDFVDHYSNRGLRDYILLKTYFYKTRYTNSNSGLAYFIVSLAGLLSGAKTDIRHKSISSRIGINNGTFQIKTNPSWVIEGYILIKELRDQICFAAQEKQILKFKTIFVQFCVILQYWGHIVKYKNVMSNFKENMLLEMGNLAKYITKNNGDCNAAFQTIFNRRKSRKFDYVSTEQSYFQAVESGEIREMIEPELQKTYEESCNQNKDSEE